MTTHPVLPWIRAAWLACAVLSGCGGSGSGGDAAPQARAPAASASSGDSGVPPVVPQDPAPEPVVPGPPNAFAYVARDAADAVAVYATDAATGQLSLQSSLALAAGSAPRHLAYDAVHHRLYMAQFGSNRIEVASADTATGTLGAPVLASTLAEPVRLAVDPQGRFLYAGYGNSIGALTGVIAFRIDAADGHLVYVNHLATFQRPTSVAIDPLGRFVYVATYWGYLVPYTIDAATGALTQGIVSPLGLSDLAFDASGNRLYGSNGMSPYTDLFDVHLDGSFGMSQMMSMTGFPSNAIALDPAGRYLHTLDPYTKTVQSLPVSPANGQLASGPTLALPAGCTPLALAVAPDSRSLHVACDAGGALLGYAVNRSTGALTPLAASPAGVGGRSIVFVPTP